MIRRGFLRGCASAATIALPALGARAQGVGSADPPSVGLGKLDVMVQGPDGRVLVTDSLSYIDKTVTPDDVVISASYAGATTVAIPLQQGVKGVIAHDAGVGKDQAGISALPFGDKYGIPVASVAAASAILSNGNSVMQGTISYANKTAQALGVRAGMSAREAGVLMLKAPTGHKVDGKADVDNSMVEMASTPKGRILAVWALIFLPEPHPNDVFCLATHSARVAAEHAFKWNVKAWVANDAGPGKNDSGITGLAICGEKGMPAASVAAMSARIGDAMSTWQTGIISALNEPAKARGVALGMSAQQALRLMAA